MNQWVLSRQGYLRPAVQREREREIMSVLKVTLASPRGFCAGVERAIHIVENALIKYGAPVYVRHEIVHNRYVVDGLKAKGAVFVDELDSVPEGANVIFSAHGVAKQVFQDAKNRKLDYIDATCPLVSKVHKGAQKFYRDGCQLILIGHAGHPEVIGTMGQLPAGAVVLVETPDDVDTLDFPADTPLAYVTQTTLSVSDTQEIIARLNARFPEIHAPRRSDICYATSNRQDAVRALADEADLILVIGAENSSNSNRLVEVARHSGCVDAHLIACQSDIDWSWFVGKSNLGLTAGASAPEELIQGVIGACEERFEVEIALLNHVEEDMHFPLPRIVANVDKE